MSAGAAVQGGLMLALASIDGLTAFDAPPVRAAVPYLVVGEPVLTEWSAVGVDGREAKVAVTLHDAGERPVRLRELLGEIEAAVAGLTGTLDDGWRVANARVVRSRVAAPERGRWAATGEVMVRIYRAG